MLYGYDAYLYRQAQGARAMPGYMHTYIGEGEMRRKSDWPKQTVPMGRRRGSDGSG